MARDIYQDVTDKLVAAIEAGADKWVMPWHAARGVAGGAMSHPMNGTTKRRYRGINVVILWAEARARGYNSNCWASYRQWAAAGAQVRKGEKGTEVVFFSKILREDRKTGEVKAIPLLKFSYVFNADQCDAVPVPQPTPAGTLAERIHAVDQYVKHTGAAIRIDADKACYVPMLDQVHMPAFGSFRAVGDSTATENYYGTLLHELVHWTSPKARCDRELGKRFGDDAYAMEELIAELGAAFACAALDVRAEPSRQNAAYLTSWLRALKADKRAIFTAATKAAQAVDFLDSLQPDAAQDDDDDAVVVAVEDAA